jgi:hypothetical protein
MNIDLILIILKRKEQWLKGITGQAGFVGTHLYNTLFSKNLKELILRKKYLPTSTEL